MAAGSTIVSGGSPAQSPAPERARAQAYRPGYPRIIARAVTARRQRYSGDWKHPLTTGAIGLISPDGSSAAAIGGRVAIARRRLRLKTGLVLGCLTFSRLSARQAFPAASWTAASAAGTPTHRCRGPSSTTLTQRFRASPELDANVGRTNVVNVCASTAYFSTTPCLAPIPVVRRRAGRPIVFEQARGEYCAWRPRSTPTK